jgi:hypothetical protein
MSVEGGEVSIVDRRGSTRAIPIADIIAAKLFPI